MPIYYIARTLYVHAIYTVNFNFRKVIMYLKINSKGACMDLVTSRKVHPDVAPAFRVQKLIRNLENEFSEEIMQIAVNNRNRAKWDFNISTLAMYDSQPLLAEFCKHRLMIKRDLEPLVIDHLFDEYERCDQNGLVSYHHHSLGWTEIQGKEVFLYDNNVINGITSQSDRSKFRFRSGSEQVYKDFLKNTVYPVPTLSLAMAIGYSAVVISRLKNHVDLGTVIVNLCGASSTGKTTVEELLVSAFACPKESNGDGLIRTFHATQNATFAALEGIHGLPIALDDTTSNSSLNLANLVYTLATGEEKARCQQGGGLQDSKGGWSGLIVVSSETPIHEEECENQGLKARVLQTQGITWTPDAATAELIKRTVRANYGFTGFEFAQFIEGIDVNDLYERYKLSRECVNALMPIRDNLSDRLEEKYAAIHLTVELMNECFALKLDADQLLALMLQPEQANVMERDIALKGELAIRDYLVSHFQHFDRYGKNLHNEWMQTVPASGTRFGFVYDDRENQYFEANILNSKVNEILKDANIFETSTVKARWEASKLIVTDKDNYAPKKNGVRCIRFIFRDGFTCGPTFAPGQAPLPPTVEPVPIGDQCYDDEEAINEIFGGDDE